MSKRQRANAEQQQAISTVEGPLLIIAGPGSGKTFTLVERIVHLVIYKGIAPSSLFVSTFTEKAAQELVTRISNRLLEEKRRINLNEMYLGTMHSLCLRIIEEHREFTRLKRNFRVMDQFDQQFFLYQHLRAYDEIPGINDLIGDPKTPPWLRAQELVQWINKVSEEALEASKLLADGDERVRAIGAAYRLYEQQIDEANALDFSTIQVEALRLLDQQPGVLGLLQEQLHYLMIDEYQDTNTVQEMILLRLAGQRQNLCVVGDDDQGLYRFRGATIRNILEFPSRFERCTQVRLVTNYRSHPDIIRFYNDWMQQQDWTEGGQSFRFDKQIVARDNVEFPETAAVLHVSGAPAPGRDTWGPAVVAFLQDLRARGVIKDWNQVAFLFYSLRSAPVKALAGSLEAAGIPVYAPRSDLFFERPEVRHVIGALLFLFPQYFEIREGQRKTPLEIWSYYDDCFREFTNVLRMPEQADLRKWAASHGNKHRKLDEPLDYAFTGLFYALLQFPLFSQHLGDGAQGDVRQSRAARNLAILSQILNKFEYLHHITVLGPHFLEKNLKDLFNNYLRFLWEGGITEYEDASEYAPSGCVSFLTIHQAKGMEFPVVMVGSLWSVPRRQHEELDAYLQANHYHKPPFEPLEQTKIYDFRRMFYTAFSRAQSLLALTCQERKPGRGSTRIPSALFEPMYRPLPAPDSATFHPERLDLEPLKDVNLKQSYAFTSHISLYENCPEQYRLFKYLEFTPVRKNTIVFGTLVHHTIEDVHKAVLRGEEGRVTNEQIDSWFQQNYASLKQLARVYLSESALKAARGHVQRYVDRERGRWDRLREAEVDVSLVKDRYILHGSIDLVRGESGSVEIVDFKSEKKPDVNADSEKLERYRRQLEVYAHLVEERTGHTVSKMHLYYTGEDAGSPYISFPKKKDSIERTIATFDEIVGRIEGRDFAMAERPHKLCKQCDLKPYCDAK